jgi:signal transduction histidine kinase
LSNAVRYGDGKPIGIRVDASPAGAEVHVVDHGIGIAPEDVERIFQRFERAVGHNKAGGFGIGLWLAHQLVLAHGGSLEVHSELGRGSRFCVRLPREATGSDTQTGTVIETGIN